jgi:hypothetical protein
MYVFDYGVSTDEIEKHLGIEYPDYIEFKRQLVFLKDGKIAYRENLLTSVSGAVDGAVEFSNLDYNHHLLLTPDTAIYKAQKYSPDGSKVVYFLKQTE